MAERFLVTSGTVLGREHARLFRNNQDGIGLCVEDRVISAVVSDGCSEGGASEIGAKLAAQWLAAWGPLYGQATGFEPGRFVSALARGLIRHLDPFVRSLSTSPGIDPAVIQEFFLFTFLMLIMTEERTTIFGVGDGVFSVDGRTTVLDAGEENAPPYVGYRLVPGAVEPGREIYEPRIHFDGPTSSVDAILIGTDGAASLEVNELLEDQRFLRNRTLLHKRLRVLSTERRLDDDTTVVLVRRRP